MALKFKRTDVDGDIPVFQQTHEVSQSGYTLDTTGLIAGSKIPVGSVLIADDLTRKAKLVKTATIVEAAAGGALAYKVAKGNQLATGENISLVFKGAAYPATVDRSNALYDLLTVPTSLGAAAVGAVLYQSATTGASNSAIVGTPKGLLYHSTIVEDNATVTIVLRGTVYARRIPGVPADVQALLPLIIFSQSK
jgi:hypothetical protein